jgi:hypothetical protein
MTGIIAILHRYGSHDPKRNLLLCEKEEREIFR